MILYEEKECKGYTCKVYYDPDPTSPDNWDLIGTVYSNSKKYNLQNHSMSEIVEVDENGWHVNEDYIYVRIYCYEHSGITIWSTREPQKCGWDTGLFGIYAAKKTEMKKIFGDLSVPQKYENALKQLECEVELWDMYFRGDVYGYEVYDNNYDFVDSCWGFYGDPNEAMERGIELIEYTVERIEKYERICEPFWID